MNARHLGIVHRSEAANQRYIVPDPFLAIREAIQWYQAYIVSLFHKDGKLLYVAVCETTAGRWTIQKIESASDGNELCNCCKSDHSKWENRIHHSMIHNTRLFLCDHREWSRQITGHSCHSRRIGIDWHLHGIPSSCLHDTLELTFWIHRYNTTPAHLFLASWSACYFMALIILHIIDIDRLVTYMILEYSFGRGISNCHWSLRDPSRLLLALLGWHSCTWYLLFHPFLLIGVNCHYYRQEPSQMNRDEWKYEYSVGCMVMG